MNNNQVHEAISELYLSLRKQIEKNGKLMEENQVLQKRIQELENLLKDNTN